MSLRQWQPKAPTAVVPPAAEKMATRSTDASEDQPVETSTTSGKKAEAIEPAGADGDGEVEAEGKAPAHDASDAGQKASTTAVQAQNKAELAKVARTLREDAVEGESTAVGAEDHS